VKSVGGAGREPLVELAHRSLEVRHDERDLERGESCK
jgi:hypothetical protein